MPFCELGGTDSTFFGGRGHFRALAQYPEVAFFFLFFSCIPRSPLFTSAHSPDLAGALLPHACRRSVATPFFCRTVDDRPFQSRRVSPLSRPLPRRLSSSLAIVYLLILPPLSYVHFFCPCYCSSFFPQLFMLPSANLARRL